MLPPKKNYRKAKKVQGWTKLHKIKTYYIWVNLKDIGATFFKMNSVCMKMLFIMLGNHLARQSSGRCKVLLKALHIPPNLLWTLEDYGRHNGLMVSMLDSGLNGLGSSTGRDHCIVSLGKALYSHSAHLQPDV